MFVLLFLNVTILIFSWWGPQQHNTAKGNLQNTDLLAWKGYSLAYLLCSFPSHSNLPQDQEYTDQLEISLAGCLEFFLNKSNNFLFHCFTTHPKTKQNFFPAYWAMIFINSLFYRLTYILTLLDKLDPFPSTFYIQSFSRCPIIVILVSLEALPSLPTLFMKCCKLNQSMRLHGEK